MDAAAESAMVTMIDRGQSRSLSKDMEVVGKYVIASCIPTVKNL